MSSISGEKVKDIVVRTWRVMLMQDAGCPASNSQGGNPDSDSAPTASRRAGGGVAGYPLATGWWRYLGVT